MDQQQQAPQQQAQAPAFRVFIGNLNYSTTWDALKDICTKEVGAVNYVRMPMRQGRPAGHAVVEFPSQELADKAVEVLADIEIDGRRIFVKHDEPRMPQANGAAPRQISAQYTAQYVPRQHQGQQQQQSQGQAAAAPRVQQPRAPAVDEHGNPLPKKRDGEDHCSIFINNLPYTCSWQDLKDLARPFGNVVFADVFRDRVTMRSRGIGVVRFDAREAVPAAVEGLNGADFRGRSIYVRKFEPRADGETGVPAAVGLADKADE